MKMNEYTQRARILPNPVTYRNIKKKNLRDMSKAKKARNCEFIAGRRQVFCLLRSSQADFDPPTQPPIPWILEANFQVIKRLKLKADQYRCRS
jgi:hypothetical protein